MILATRLGYHGRGRESYTIEPRFPRRPADPRLGFLAIRRLLTLPDLFGIDLTARNYPVGFSFYQRELERQTGIRVPGDESIGKTITVMRESSPYERKERSFVRHDINMLREGFQPEHAYGSRLLGDVRLTGTNLGNPKWARNNYDLRFALLSHGDIEMEGHVEIPAATSTLLRIWNQLKFSEYAQIGPNLRLDIASEPVGNPQSEALAEYLEGFWLPDDPTKSI